jgi:dTDP-4-amino-4,6-dideoxygalactose transaminase
VIPLVDLSWQHRQIESEVLEGWREVLDSTAFILGPQVAAFEQAFAAFCETRHCVGVASGTDALELSIRALGLVPGDAVIVPANTFIASVLAVIRSGVRPVLVDCEPDGYLIDAERARAALSPEVKAVMPVHLFGQAAPVEQLLEFVGEVPIIEDAAQAQGARRQGRRVGSLGAVAATSFYPGKNIGAYGDGGAVLTDSEALAQKVRALRNWGSTRKYHHPEVGFNSRLDTIQAVVLSAKLRRLDDWNRLRQEAATRYEAMLADLEVVRPRVMPGNEHVWHLYVIRVERRDEVLARLVASGVGAGIHYPVPVHLHGALRGLGHREGDFPHAERAAAEMISLPMFPGITERQQEQVVDSLRKALAG